MDKKYYVYCHTNKINGKKYIGITCQKPTRRWCHGNGYRTCEYFHRAIQKYGWENFTHEILYENLTDSEAQEKERMLIEKFNTLVPNGYNLESGGRLNKTISGETRKKLSECRRGEKHPNYGKQMSQEQKDKIAKTLHETHVGWKHKEETKKKMSEVRKGKHLSEETKTRISMANKGCVRSIEYRKHFSEIMSGDKNPSKRMDVRAKIGTSVVQIDPNSMEVINTFITQRYAEQQTGINRKEIAKCCKGLTKYAGGYTWKFTEEGEDNR